MGRGHAHAHSHGHGHGSGAAADPLVDVRTRRLLAAIAAALALAVVVGLAALWPDDRLRADPGSFLASDTYAGTVVSVEIAPCAGTEPADEIDCRVTTVRLSEGPHAGEERTLELPEGSATSVALEEGDDVVLSYDADAEPGFEYQFADRQRRPVLWALAAVFAIAVVLLGRLRGLAALAGLVASLAVILVFVIPAILDGRSPVLVAVVGSAAIGYLALYLAHGFGPMTTVALLGTLTALALTVALSWAFTEVAQFSGLTDEESVLVAQLAGEVDVAGLVLAGIVLGALGALDDVTVTQASAVWELRAADPGMSRRRLYRAGIRIGRDHIASAVNTLALAYAGAALPLLILFVVSQQSLGSVANSEVVATEIVRTLVGSIGLVSAVPITTWLAARVVPQPAAPAAAATPGDLDAPAPPAARAAEPPPRPPARPEPDEHDDFWR